MWAETLGCLHNDKKMSQWPISAYYTNLKSGPRVELMIFGKNLKDLGHRTEDHKSSFNAKAEEILQKYLNT